MLTVVPESLHRDLGTHAFEHPEKKRQVAPISVRHNGMGRQVVNGKHRESSIPQDRDATLPAPSRQTGAPTETRNEPLNGKSISCAADVLHGSAQGSLGPNPVEDASQARLSVPTPARSTPLPSVLTVDELATLLRVNRKTVYEALSRGEIPGARRIGGRYRILRDAVIDWLASSQDCAARSRRNR